MPNKVSYSTSLQEVAVVAELNVRSKGDKGEMARIIRKLAEAHKLNGDTEKAAELKKKRLN